MMKVLQRAVVNVEIHCSMINDYMTQHRADSMQEY